MKTLFDPKVATPIEEILSCRGKVRILRILAEEGELNVSEITRRSRLNHTLTLKYLDTLKSEQLLDEKRFGRIRIFKYRWDNPKAKALSHLFDVYATPSA
jgi:DNA-binding transcriptional ArsR family regulator